MDVNVIKCNNLKMKDKIPNYHKYFILIKKNKLQIPLLIDLINKIKLKDVTKVNNGFKKHIYKISIIL